MTDYDKEYNKLIDEINWSNIDITKISKLIDLIKSNKINQFDDFKKLKGLNEKFFQNNTEFFYDLEKLNQGLFHSLSSNKLEQDLIRYKKRLLNISKRNKLIWNQKESFTNLIDLMDLKKPEWDELNDLIFNYKIIDKNESIVNLNITNEKLIQRFNSLKNQNDDFVFKLDNYNRTYFNRIIDRNNIYLKESGINCLYIGCYFLEAILSVNSDKQPIAIRAPIFLIPVKTMRDKNSFNILNKNFLTIDYDREIMLNEFLNDYFFKVENFSFDEGKNLQNNLEDFLALSENERLKNLEIPEQFQPFNDLKDTKILDDIENKYPLIKKYFVVGLFNKFHSAIEKDLANILENRLVPAELENFLNNETDFDQYEINTLNNHYYENIANDEEIYYVNKLNQEQLKALKIINQPKIRNLAIWGPPGTGKSQTIISIIYDSIIKNKTCAVIAEKLAALDVIYNRLPELHYLTLKVTDLTNKNNFYQQISEAINYYEKLNEENNFYKTNIKELKKQHHELLNKLNTLDINKKISEADNLTTLQLMKKINIVKINISEIDIEKKLIINKLIQNIKQKSLTITEIINYYHQFAAYSDQQYLDYQLIFNKNYQFNFEGLIEFYENELNELKINYQLQLELVENQKDKSLEIISTKKLNESKKHKIEKDNKWNQFNENVINSKLVIDDDLKQFNEAIEILNKITNLINNYNKYSKLMLFNKLALKIKINNLLNKLLKFNFKELIIDDLSSDVKTIKKNICLNPILLINKLNNLIINRNQIIETLAINLSEANDEFNKELDEQLNTIINKHQKEIELEEQNYQQELDYITTKYQNSKEEINLEYKFILNNEKIIKTYFAYDLVEHQLFKTLLRDALNKDCNYQHELKLIFWSIIKDFLNTIKIEEYIEEFNNYDNYKNEIFNLETKIINETKNIIGIHNEQNFADFTHNGNLMKIKKSLISKRKRPIVQFWELYSIELRAIFKLFLMRPEIMTTLIKVENKIDITFIDEASQIFIEHSIPIITRTKKTVILGDEKQLKPSDFFNGHIDEESNDDETYYDENNEISLLNHTKDKFFNIMLKNHYRSNYEELIGFSNQKFYNNELQFISKNITDKIDKAIEYINVSDGIYDHQVNENEANEILKTLIRISNQQQYNNKSVGVITMNAKQKTLIQEKIDRYARENLSFNFWYQKKLDQSSGNDFFVKSIENVQGDERDIIIFSTNFGKNLDGKTNLNFGPVSNSGGENRINVAITRAKDKMFVISSLDINSLITSIENKNLKYNGSLILAQFLEYAKSKSQNPGLKFNLNKELNFDSELEADVYKKLNTYFKTKYNWKIYPQVETSKYKIDLVIVDNNEKIICGIEVDGATFHSSRHARVNDIMRQEFLENRGWTLFRIWSTNWFSDSDKELKLLEQKILKIYQPDKTINTNNLSSDLELNENLESLNLLLTNDRSLLLQDF